MKRKNAIQLNIEDIVNKETISQLVLDQIKINNLKNAKSLIDQYHLSIYEFKKHTAKIKGHIIIFGISIKKILFLFLAKKHLSKQK